jgi:hypothetical protein
MRMPCAIIPCAGARLAFLWVAAAVALFGQDGVQATEPSPAPAAVAPSTIAPGLLPKSVYLPLTEHERLRLFLKRLVSPEAIFRSAVGAGIDQGWDSPKEWGEGALGYTRRFASGYAEHVVRETFLYGSSTLLGEDNHYVRSTETRFGRRLKYALESSVLARHADGSRHLSVSKIGSYAGASFIWRLWQPPSTSSVGNAMENFGIAMSVAAGFDVAREFLPDLFHRRP